MEIKNKLSLTCNQKIVHQAKHSHETLMDRTRRRMTAFYHSRKDKGRCNHLKLDQVEREQSPYMVSLHETSSIATKFTFPYYSPWSNPPYPHSIQIYTYRTPFRHLSFIKNKHRKNSIKNNTYSYWINFIRS